MLEMFIYPVSGVMKLWHVFLHSVLGLSDSLSWLLSIFGLIVVVRGITTPLQWMILLSGRLTVILRPQLAAIAKEYENDTDIEKIKEKDAKEKALKKEVGYTVRAGCIPPLIQVPVFLGLYQVMLRMARPRDGLDSTTHEPIGFLTSNDVASFLQTRFGNVPAPAYITMSQAQFDRLGTTYDEVVQFVVPLLILAGMLTFFTMMISTVRNFFTLDYNAKIAVRMANIVVISTFFTPVLLFFIGFTGPIPAAITVYWVGNNLWTLLQNVVIFAILHKKYPFTEEIKQYQYKIRRDRIDHQRVVRHHVWGRRIAHLGLIFNPWNKARHKERIAAATQFLNDLKTEEQAEKKRRKAVNAERLRVQMVHRRQKRIEKRKKATSQPEVKKPERRIELIEEAEPVEDSAMPVTPKVNYWSV